jgi:MFS family permease
MRRAATAPSCRYSSELSRPSHHRQVLQLTRYQWTVLVAAWLGWGFDVFDALLFNYIAPNSVPVLLGLELGSQEARAATPYWTGLLTAMLLIGWAIGGVLFGVVCDRIGRVRTMMLTMLLYALGTAACAFAPNIWVFMLFRIVASLGIGGEWAAGASMVAEVMPANRRVEAGALLYTASPLGLFLATFVTYNISGVWLAHAPEMSWRIVFLCGLIPAAIAFIVRRFLHEPEGWAKERGQSPPVRLAELFAVPIRRLTICGTLTALVALIAWWSSNAFLPTVATELARETARANGLDATATVMLIERWKMHATLAFNVGGLIGILVSIPIAKRFGRRAMFGIYFAVSSLAIFTAFGVELSGLSRLLSYVVVGIGVYGVAGVFAFYLPELFPTRVRASGSGFCYNVGRIIAAPGPFIVGAIAAQGNASEAIFYVGFIPLLGLLLLPIIVETKRPLADGTRSAAAQSMP